MAWPQCRVIDDVTTRTIQIDLRVIGTGADTNTQTGSMIGGLNFNVQVDTPVSLFEDGINLSPSSASGLPFCVDFPFSHFISNTPGAKPDFAAQGITWMDMVLQSGL